MTDPTGRRDRAPRIGPLVLLVGLAGLGLGLLLFPNSNFLGGLGPVFAIVLAVGVCGTVITGVAWLLRRSRRRGRSSE